MKQASSEEQEVAEKDVDVINENKSPQKSRRQGESWFPFTIPETRPTSEAYLFIAL
jgi:hypothetical protein